MRSFPKLLSALSRDPQVPPSDSPREEDDEDVASEAARVQGMLGRGHVGGAGEVILKELRKIYRTKQVKTRVP